MEITTNTKLIALLGKPLGFSFAAKIQNAAFAEKGLDYYYYPAEVDAEQLEAVLNAVRVMNYAGVVVTKPNKVKVLQFLDDLDPLARAMGSVNTVVKTADGRLVGYNTDGLACVRSLKEDAQVDPSQSVFFCLGTGGVGRAIAYTLAYSGAKRIYLTDIFPPALHDVFEAIEKDFPGVAETVPFDQEEAIYDTAGRCDVIMNCTGFGHGAHAGEMPFTPRLFHEGMLAFDAIYNPPVTKFLEEARKKNCRILNGMNMSVYQSAIGFKLHTGQDAPAETMMHTAREFLAHASE